MIPDKQQYSPGTRAARFLKMRDAVLAHETAMRELRAGVRELAVGPFQIHLAQPGTLGGSRPYNITIWPTGAAESGYSVHGNKIASVDWNDRDEVFIVSFNCGEWENELLKLLTSMNDLTS